MTPDTLLEYYLSIDMPSLEASTVLMQTMQYQVWYFYSCSLFVLIYFYIFRLIYKAVFKPKVLSVHDQYEYVLILFVQISSGCDDSTVLCFYTLADPVVTNEIHLYPIIWHNSISLQIKLMGQIYANFNRKLVVFRNLYTNHNGKPTLKYTSTVIYTP